MSKDLKQAGKVVEQLSRGRIFQGDTTVRAKVLDCLGTVRMPPASIEVRGRE